MTIDNKFIPYARQSIDEEDIRAVSQALSADMITRGTKVEQFEQAVAEYCGAKYAVAFNSGSSALFGAAYAARVSSVDRLITSPNSFVTTAAAVHFGATPHFIDIDRNTGSLQLDLLGPILKEPQYERRNIIVPVHFAGIPVDMRKLESMIYGLDDVVIEDAAHAFGSCYTTGQRIGCCAWSQMTVFSFHPAKTITTGEGGMVLTNDLMYDRRLRSYRNNCIERDPTYLQGDPSIRYEGYYEVPHLSGNYNFTDFQAALGLSQLQKIDQFIEKRRELVSIYRKAFGEMPYMKFFTAEHDSKTAFHLFVVQIQFSAFKTSRQTVMQRLKERGIGTQVHYMPLYRHPLFARRPEIEFAEEYPETETYFAEALTLPLYVDLTTKQVTDIVQALKDILIEERQRRRHPQKRKKSGR